MKKFIISSVDVCTEIGNENPKLQTFELEGSEDMQGSDGYHTFDELYEHRFTLYIALCKQLASTGYPESPGYVWRSHEHSDGSIMDGWFLLGINQDHGKQITYHLPARLWNDCEFADFRKRAPEFDGHTSANVLERIKDL